MSQPLKVNKVLAKILLPGSVELVQWFRFNVTIQGLLISYS